jgi:hypothetical protein
VVIDVDGLLSHGVAAALDLPHFRRCYDMEGKAGFFKL